MHAFQCSATLEHMFVSTAPSPPPPTVVRWPDLSAEVAQPWPAAARPAPPKAVAVAARAVSDLGTALSRESLNGLGPEDLREVVALLRRLEGMAAARMASAVRLLDRHGALDRDGASSPTAWVSEHTGRSAREATRLVRLGANLDDLPATSSALERGELTVEAADAICRAAGDATLGPQGEVEAELALVATATSPEQLRRTIRDRRQAADATAMLRDERRQHAMRSTSLTRRPDGMWHLRADLPEELGTMAATALDAFERPDPAGTPIEERRRPDQRRTDALADLLGVVLDQGLAPTTNGVRPHVVVTVDAAAVSARIDPQRPVDDPTFADLPAGRTDWGGSLSPQAVRRILCDAGVARVVTAGASQPLDTGRLTRQWSPAQRRAVNARDRQCRGPTCDRPIAWTEVHHIQWWERDRGPTSVDNGLALCRHCHQLVHNRGWIVELDLATAEATWTRPDGRVVRTRPPPT